MIPMQREYRDRDYIQTPEGFIFCVVDSLHPKDRVTAYLKYIPSPMGKWGDRGKKYNRILAHYTMLELKGTINFLEKYPDYLFFSQVMNIKMSFVPLNKIVFHFKPEEKLSKLQSLRKRDDLQQKVIELTNLVSESSGIPTRYFGVTGSILLDIHQDFSDIDLIVYGKSNTNIVKETLLRLYNENNKDIRWFDDKMTNEWCIKKSKLYPLTFEEAKIILKKKWNRGFFKNIFFSLHPVKLERDVSEKYGDKIFQNEGLIKLKAKILDSSESEFLPAIYRIQTVDILDKNIVDDITEIVSYEGLYGGIAEEGETITVYGKLERVFDNKSKKSYHRVLVGSKEAEGKDYIKPLFS